MSKAEAKSKKCSEMFHNSLWAANAPDLKSPVRAALQSDCPRLWPCLNTVAQFLTFVPPWRRVSVTSFSILQASDSCEQWNTVPMTVCDSKACWGRPQGFLWWPGASRRQVRKESYPLTLTFHSNVHVTQKASERRSGWQSSSVQIGVLPALAQDKWVKIRADDSSLKPAQSIRVEFSHLWPWTWSRDKSSKPGPGWIADLQSCNVTTWSLSQATTLWERSMGSHWYLTNLKSATASKEFCSLLYNIQT